MLKVAPPWYVKLIAIGLMFGLLGIFPSLLIEVAIWGVADGRIMVWLMVVLLISILMPLLFSDTRRMLFYETKNK